MKIQDILYSKHNNTPFKLIKIKNQAINKGIFGMEHSEQTHTFINMKTNKQTVLSDEHVRELLYKI